MSKNLGKAFEKKFSEDFSNIEGSSLDRLYDVTMGYKNISQISDFIGYIYPYIYYLELKSIQQKSFPFSNFSQYEKLKRKLNIKGVRAGVILWYILIDKVVYIPERSFIDMQEKGYKSISYEKLVQNNIYFIEIPSKKKRVFLDSDYSVLSSILDDEVIKKHNEEQLNGK